MNNFDWFPCEDKSWIFGQSINGRIDNGIAKVSKRKSDNQCLQLVK